MKDRNKGGGRKKNSGLGLNIPWNTPVNTDILSLPKKRKDNDKKKKKNDNPKDPPKKAGWGNADVVPEDVPEKSPVKIEEDTAVDPEKSWADRDSDEEQDEQILNDDDFEFFDQFKDSPASPVKAEQNNPFGQNSNYGGSRDQHPAENSKFVEPSQPAPKRILKRSGPPPKRTTPSVIQRQTKDVQLPERRRERSDTDRFSSLNEGGNRRGPRRGNKESPIKDIKENFKSKFYEDAGDSRRGGGRRNNYNRSEREPYRREPRGYQNPPRDVRDERDGRYGKQYREYPPRRSGDDYHRRGGDNYDSRRGRGGRNYDSRGGGGRFRDDRSRRDEPYRHGGRYDNRRRGDDYYRDGRSGRDGYYDRNRGPQDRRYDRRSPDRYDNRGAPPEEKRFGRKTPDPRDRDAPRDQPVRRSPEKVKVKAKETVRKSPEKKEVVRKSPEKKEVVRKSPEKKEVVRKSPEKKEVVRKSPEKKEVVRKKPEEPVRQSPQKKDVARKNPEKRDEQVRKSPQKKKNNVDGNESPNRDNRRSGRDRYNRRGDRDRRYGGDRDRDRSGFDDRRVDDPGFSRSMFGVKRKQIEKPKEGPSNKKKAQEQKQPKTVAQKKKNPENTAAAKGKIHLVEEKKKNVVVTDKTAKKPNLDIVEDKKDQVVSAAPVVVEVKKVENTFSANSVNPGPERNGNTETTGETNAWSNPRSPAIHHSTLLSQNKDDLNTDLDSEEEDMLTALPENPDDIMVKKKKRIGVAPDAPIGNQQSKQQPHVEVVEKENKVLQQGDASIPSTDGDKKKPQQVKKQNKPNAAQKKRDLDSPPPFGTNNSQRYDKKRRYKNNNRYRRNQRRGRNNPNKQGGGSYENTGGYVQDNSPNDPFTPSHGTMYKPPPKGKKTKSTGEYVTINDKNDPFDAKYAKENQGGGDGGGYFNRKRGRGRGKRGKGGRGRRGRYNNRRRGKYRGSRGGRGGRGGRRGGGRRGGGRSFQQNKDM